MIVDTHSPQETQELGEALGRGAVRGDVILLEGNLGAGKTCLTQGIALGLGIQGPVRSPTFILANEHHGRLTLYHVDLYRLDALKEVEDLGLDDYIEGDGLTVVEWADKAPTYFPSQHLLVHLERTGETSRRIRFTPRGQRYVDLLESIAKRASHSDV